jgi:hypothetical protein
MVSFYTFYFSSLLEIVGKSNCADLFARKGLEKKHYMTILTGNGLMLSYFSMDRLYLRRGRGFLQKYKNEVREELCVPFRG